VADGTKAETRPTEKPRQARKPASTAKAGKPRKARKPSAARKAAKPRGSASGAPGSPGGSGGNGRAQEPGGSADSSLPTPAETLVKATAPGGSSLARKAAWKAAKLAAGRMLSSGASSLSGISGDGVGSVAQTIGAVRQMALSVAGTTVEVDGSGRPPIQSAIDAAVPCRVAWREWIRLEWLPEGVDAVLGIERDGDELTGHLRGEGDATWSARVLDEREQESFAWESSEGSDCAGLITFHELGERLTRIELSLDVRPVGLGQAAALSIRRADRRAGAELRRFKARLELISPDLYADSDGTASDRDTKSR
jgi:uncharacterized membrane protein